MQHLFCARAFSVGVVALVLGAGVGFAQEKVKTEPVPTTSKETDSVDRLPRNWATLELSEEQREKIYAINRKSKETVDAAEKEVLRLREEYAKARQALAKVRLDVDQERVNVLTDAQKQKLAAIREKSRSRFQAATEEALKKAIKVDTDAKSAARTEPPKKEK
jgi:Spy/CpxP family protein refolding chaperone